MINELLNKINVNTTLEEEINIKKAEILEKQKPSTKEIILYFDEKELGFINDNFSFADLDLIETLTPKFAKRSLLEYIPSQRHPIPYCVVKYNEKYFLISREKGSGESRLIGQMGLLGGHVGIEDVVYCNKGINIQETIKNGMFRELEEESGITEKDINDCKFLGLIKMKNNGVENDHLGIIYLIDLTHSNINTLENGVISGNWFSKEDIINNMDCLENWSKLIFSNLL